MRIILMRHGESGNNILALISKQVYEQVRTHEPELSDIGQESCRRMGEEMNKLNFKIDKIYCSAHKRAILSAKFFREGFFKFQEQNNIEKLPIHLKVNIHELGGIYMGEKCFPGLNKKQVKELVNDIIIPEKEQIWDEKGWFQRETIEEEEELYDRIKEVIRDLKEMHRENSNQTILMISHGCFLRCLMQHLVNQQS